MLSETALSAAGVLADMGEAMATRLLECTRRLALSTPQIKLRRDGGSDAAAGLGEHDTGRLLRMEGGGSNAAGGVPHYSSSGLLPLGATARGDGHGGSSSRVGPGRMMGGSPQQTARPLLLLQGALTVRGDGIKMRQGSRFLTDPAGWMSPAGAADDEDTASLLLSRRQQQQQLARGSPSRGSTSLPRARQQQLPSSFRSRVHFGASVEAAVNGADPRLGELRRKVRRGERGGGGRISGLGT